jgi:hypothetical protein
MRITEKQLLLLVRVLEGSLNIKDAGVYFGIDSETRTKLYSQIMNQQSDILIDIKDELGEKTK